MVEINQEMQYYFLIKIFQLCFSYMILIACVSYSIPLLGAPQSYILVCVTC